MGYVASRIDIEGRVRVCKERKKLMKQLVGYREEFADAQLAYLRALKNTGVTLRQFTEPDSLELDNISSGQTLPPSPHSPLPLPPPPSFSPDSRKVGDNCKVEAAREGSMEITLDNCSTPPRPTASSSWNYWDLFEYASPICNPKQSETIEPVWEESWAESKMEFEDEDQGEELVKKAISPLPEKPPPREIVDENTSMMSWFDKDSTDVAAVVLKNRKTLEGITKELDDYFLKASAGGKEIAVFTDINVGTNSLPWKLNENKSLAGNSNEFFRCALSWSWSSKSLLLARDDFQRGSGEPCKPGAHCITLGKLYAAEQMLYKEVKVKSGGRNYQIRARKKLMLPQKQDKSHDWTKTEKIRSSVENLENDITHLQHSISTDCSSIAEKAKYLNSVQPNKNKLKWNNLKVNVNERSDQCSIVSSSSLLESSSTEISIAFEISSILSRLRSRNNFDQIKVEKVLLLQISSHC
ncbi:putative Root phototropism protein [Hibiscus syriacus]|uniref:Root phototropism protein n=1 Tax=Hibiscus syriacus TaxID=106335 RepID=A0A6A3A4Q3_HIBSY|nr:putative Root phototropism protein [Hibiscus syriacus]